MKIHNKIVYNLATHRYHIDDITVANSFDITEQEKVSVFTHDFSVVDFQFGENNEFDYEKNSNYYEINKIKCDCIGSFEYYQIKNLDKFIELLTNEHSYHLMIFPNSICSLNITDVYEKDNYLFVCIKHEYFIFEKDCLISFIEEWINFYKYLIKNKLLIDRANYGNIINIAPKCTINDFKDYSFHFTAFYDYEKDEYINVYDDMFDSIINQIHSLCPNLVYDIDYKIEN